MEGAERRIVQEQERDGGAREHERGGLGQLAVIARGSTDINLLDRPAAFRDTAELEVPAGC